MRDTKRLWQGQSTSWVVLFLLLIVGLTPIIPSYEASAAGPTLSQSALTVEVGTATTLVVTTIAAPVGAHLKFYADPGIQARVQTRGPQYWIVTVGAHAGLTEGLLTVQLVSRSGKNLGFAQAKIVAKAQPIADTVIQATLVLDSDSLVEGPDLQAFLAITNRSDQALRIGPLRALVPKGIELDPGNPPGLLLPRHTLVAPIKIAVSDDVESAPGKHMVGVAIPVTDDLTAQEASRAAGAVGHRGWSGEIIATKEVTLSVPGVSAVEGVLQIPSLLLLPGLLAFVTYSAILNLVKPRPAGEDPLSRLSIVLSPVLWVVMIMTSGAIGLCYGLLSGRNILYAYALRDVVWLWFISILAGAIVGAGTAWRKTQLEARAAAPRFASGISALAFLRQLDREGVSLRLRSKQTAGLQLFELGPGPSNAEVWACGRIEYRFLGTRDDIVAQDVRTAVDAGDVSRISGHAEAGHIALAWREFSNAGVRVAAPQLVSRDLFKPPVAEDAIVQEAV